MKAELHGLDLLKKIYQDKILKKPWTKAIEAQLIQDFTYHSSKIEGLTLTYHETISYLKYGFLERKQQSKDDAVDISSIKNHQQILELYFNEYENKSLSIENIQNAQKIIYEAEFLNKPFDIYNPALGEYKYQSNFVRLKDELGNMYFHEFMKPHLVTQAMIKIVEETNIKLNNINVNTIELHPLVIAAQFQYEFLNIHPFQDGNGRTARLFSNLIVMKNHYPPLLIRGEGKQRDDYLKAVSECNVNDVSPLVHHFIGEMTYVIEEGILYADLKEKGNA